jgi:SDR family mycofactocin-dependent oxidoreductase
MTNRVQGKVAFITGAARGQGRSHAVRLAQEGADIIAVDICAGIDGMGYPMASEEDLAETVRAVEALDRRIVAVKADVRDQASVDAAVSQGLATMGKIDIVVANAGVNPPPAPAWELSEQSWRAAADVNLDGVWRTCKAAIPSLIAAGRGGAIVITSSAAGLEGLPNMAGYCASKHGVVGLMRTLAIELAPHSIRVNSVHPGSVETEMICNPAVYRLFRPDLPDPAKDDIIAPLTELNLLPVPWVQPVDISNAVLYLASDEARYVTGVTFPVDAGDLLR